MRTSTALALCISLAACSVPAVSFTLVEGGPGDAGPVDGPVDGAPTDTGTVEPATARITVRRGGGAGGSVSAQGAELSCGDTCSASVATGTSITLVASPDVGAVFGGWSGGCTGTGPTCTVSVVADITVDARFDVATFAVDISLLGTGGGTVTSMPAGLSCPGACRMSVAHNTTVELVASPSATSSFLGWDGACSGTGTCRFTVTADTAASAAFAENPQLVVTRGGSGSGTVSSNPAGIACGQDCSRRFAPGTVVTLTATPTSGSSFAGWSGACAGAGTCQVTMSSAASVTATFTTITGLLAVANFQGRSLAIFPNGASGNVAPIRRIAGNATLIGALRGVAVVNNEIIAMDQNANAVTVFSITADGDVPPLRRIVGPATGLNQPAGVLVRGGEIYVGQQNGVVAVFPLTASGDVAPTRTITGIGEAEDMAIVGDELYVADVIGDRIVVFPVNASGAAVPSRIISGPATGLETPVGLLIQNGEIIVGNGAGSGRISVFAQSASGNAAPLRVISGNNTGLLQSLQIAVFGGEIFVTSFNTNSVDVFPLAASGDIAPVRRIAGAATFVVGPAGVCVF